MRPPGRQMSRRSMLWLCHAMVVWRGLAAHAPSQQRVPKKRTRRCALVAKEPRRTSLLHAPRDRGVDQRARDGGVPREVAVPLVLDDVRVR